MVEVRFTRTKARTTGLKVCGGCATAKPIGEFHTYKYTTNQGKQSQRTNARCKPCKKAERQKRPNAGAIASCKAWRAANAETVKQYQHQYRKDKPEAKRLSERKRKAVGGHVSVEFVPKLRKRQNNKCACCFISLAGGYHIDHIIPLALGGPHDEENIQLLCPPCNLAKGAKDPVVFAQECGRLL